MRWHIEIVLEVILLLVLICRPRGLRWFEVLIGIDLAAQLIQIIPYRTGYPQFSRLFWKSSLILIAAARVMALIESGDPWSQTSLMHRWILSFWTAGATCCAFMMVGQSDAVIFHVNTALLIIQAVSFSSWIALFLISE